MPTRSLTWRVCQFRHLGVETEKGSVGLQRQMSSSAKISAESLGSGGLLLGIGTFVDPLLEQIDGLLLEATEGTQRHLGAGICWIATRSDGGLDMSSADLPPKPTAPGNIWLHQDVGTALD